MKLGVCKKKKTPKNNEKKYRQNKEIFKTKNFLHYPSQIKTISNYK